MSKAETCGTDKVARRPIPLSAGLTVLMNFLNIEVMEQIPAFMKISNFISSYRKPYDFLAIQIFIVALNSKRKRFRIID